MNDTDNLSQPTVPAEHPAESFEPRDFQQGPLLRLGVIFVLALVVAAAIPVIEETVFSGLLPNLSPQPPVLSALPGVATPAAPQLETLPGQSLQQQRAHEDEVLGTYAWADKKRGVVRIPIDRAMQLLLQRGLPVQAAGTYQDEGTQLPGASSSGRMMETVHP